MTRHGYGTTILLALAAALFALPAAAQEQGMTAPPWGDAGARITFGDEDQGVLQIQYKGQFRFNLRDTGSGLDGEDTTTSFGFRRNRLSRAVARCQRARENAHQDAVGQPFVDVGEAKAALAELRDAL